MEPTLTPPTTPVVSRKVIVLAIAAGTVILIIIASLIITQATKQPSTETATPTATPTPTDQAKAPSLIEFQNFDILFDEGIAKDQVDGLKFAINKYAKINQKSAESVSINAGTIRTVLHNSKAGQPHDITTFNINFSNKVVLTAKAEYFDLTAVHVYLTDAKSTVVFDSGVIDIYNGLGTN